MNIEVIHLIQFILKLRLIILITISLISTAFSLTSLLSNKNQTAIAMNMFLYSIGFSIFLNGYIKCEFKFSDFDLSVIGQASKLLNSQCIVIVESRQDESLIKSIKTFSGKDVYSAVVNSTHLENILTKNVSQLNFLQRRTFIVTKENINLTALLGKVSLPHYVTWMLFTDHALFPDLYIPVSSTVIFIHSTPGAVSAKQVYHLKPGVNETVTTLWIWNSTDPPHAIPLGFEFQKMNFHKVSMDMLILSPDEVCQKVHGVMLLRKLECVHQDFLKLIGERLNFSINIVECQEKEHPFTYPNGSDSELFLRLKHREVDFSAISHIVRIHMKRQYIEFVWPTFVLKSKMYLKQSRLSGRWASYLRPLESSVWWGILIWIITSGILILVFEKLLAGELKFNFAFILEFFTSTLKTLQVFCNQAVSDMPESYSIRIIFFLKFFVMLIFFQAYCGYLVSSLTIVVTHFPFKDLKGFFENQQYQVMTLRRGFHQYYFKKLVGVGKREGFMLPPQELPETIQEAVDKLCTQEYLTFSEFRENLLNFDKLKCKISELPSPVERLFMGIGFPSKTPVKEYFRRELLLLKSTGLAQRLGSRLSSRSDFRDENSQEEFVMVSMTQIFSIFILLGMGVLLSIFIFMIELAIEKSRQGEKLEQSINEDMKTYTLCGSGNQLDL